jgi:hypothetical protein
MPLIRLVWLKPNQASLAERGKSSQVPGLTFVLLVIKEMVLLLLPPKEV